MDYMRICIATPMYPPDIGGPATYSKLIHDELPHHGFVVDVISFGDVKYLSFIARHIAYFFKLLKKGKNADIIFAQDPLGVGFPALSAARILGKKFVLKIVGDRAWEEYMNQESGIRNQECDLLDEFQKKRYGANIEVRRFLQKYVARHADKIIVPSDYLKKILIEGWGIDDKKIKVIHNAFELPKINITHDEARVKLLLSGYVVVSIGRLVPWKGFGTLIDIFPEILKKCHNAKLHIIGDGTERKNLKSQISNLKLEDNVSLIGQLSHDEAMLYLIAADVFVLNTGYEGLSHTILEAMVLGVPVVTTCVGGNIELIKDGVSGRLVEYQDKEALSKAIIEILGDSACTRECFKTAAQKTVSEFSKEKMLAHLTQIFKKICVPLEAGRGRDTQ